MGSELRGLPSDEDGGDFAGKEQLAQALSGFARTAQLRPDLHGTLVEIVRASIDIVPGCEEASISVILGRKKARSEAASGELPRIVDIIQEQVGGPCMDAAYAQQTVRVADMATEQRWPRFTQRALEAGAAGMLSIQLWVEGDNMGALNLFSRKAGAFDDESEHIGLMLASHASVAYAASRQQDNLQRKVDTRQLIGCAEGILMERHKITHEQAFALLVRASQSRNIRLREIAEQLVMTGDASPTA